MATEAAVPDRPFEPFFAVSADLLCTASFDGVFLQVNDAWEELLGWTADELVEVPFVELVHPEDRAATRAETQRLADGGRTVRFRNRYRHRDGSYRALLWNAAADVAARRIYAIARDVTGEEDARAELRSENARLEAANVALSGSNAGLASDNDELSRLNSELARLNDQLERFAYVVSHDLSEPLRSIAGFAQLLERRLGAGLDDTSRDYLRRLVAATLRQQELIADLRRYTRTTSDDLARESVDCAGVVADVLRDLARIVDETGATVEVGRLPTVQGDARLLSQVFQNLIANALKFRGAAAPRVKISSRRTEFGWEFSVRDNGIGIAPEYRKRVFDVFQRLHTRAEYDGTGVGLAVVRGAVERHGGCAWIAETPGGGLDVRFELPDDPDVHARAAT